MYSHFVEKVVFLGAESTGKSTLSARMAEEMNTVSVSEYGRLFYEVHGGELTEADYVTIANTHRYHEDVAARQANRYLFVDTNAMTTMMFSHLYNRTSAEELRDLANDCVTRYQHVIVCDDDIAFVQDGWRDSETWRTRMQGMVLHDLAVRGINYSVVRGSLDQRVEQVKQILNGESPRTTRAYESSGPKAKR